MAETTPASYCAQELRRHDHDRYLTCLFAPAARREALFALYAFNLEVAKTAELVSEPMLGRIRLQWWREAIDEIYGGRPRRHEVIGPLGAAVTRHGLSRAHFDRLIDGREFDLDGEAPDTLARLEAYAEATSAGLNLLALEILGAADEAGRSAAREVGIAWALTGLLRAVPFHARQKRLYLPRDMVDRAGLRLGDLFELHSSDALKQVVRQVAGHAAERLRQARAGRSGTAKAALPALLPAILAGHYLGVLAQADHDPFHESVQTPPSNNVWRLLWPRLLGRF
jgi:phytoene synthase